MPAGRHAVPDLTRRCRLAPFTENTLSLPPQRPQGFKAQRLPRACTMPPPPLPCNIRPWRALIHENNGQRHLACRCHAAGRAMPANHGFVPVFEIATEHEKFFGPGSSEGCPTTLRVRESVSPVIEIATGAKKIQERGSSESCPATIVFLVVSLAKRGRSVGGREASKWARGSQGGALPSPQIIPPRRRWRPSVTGTPGGQGTSPLPSERHSK